MILRSQTEMVCGCFLLQVCSSQPEVATMCRTEAILKRNSLRQEIDTLKSRETGLRQQIGELARRGSEIERERMAKQEQLTELNMMLLYDA